LPLRAADSTKENDMTLAAKNVVSTAMKKTANVIQRDHRKEIDINNSVITAESRQQMIAEAAYYRAERRGFARGDELIDWLKAEQEISAMSDEPYNESRDPDA
jgi:hypothetical protein